MEAEKGALGTRLATFLEMRCKFAPINLTAWYFRNAHAHSLKILRLTAAGCFTKFFVIPSLDFASVNAFVGSAYVCVALKTMQWCTR